MVPEARVELARLSTTVFETAASAIPPLGREIELYPMFPKAQTEISEHAQKAMILDYQLYPNTSHIHPHMCG